MEEKTQENQKHNLLDLFKEMLDDHLGKKEFTDAFQRVLKVAKDLLDTNKAEFDAIRATVDALSKKLTEDNMSDLASFKADAKTLLDAQIASLRDVVAKAVSDAETRVSELKDGEDGQDGNRITTVSTARLLPTHAIIGDISIVEDTGEIYFYE